MKTALRCTVEGFLLLPEREFSTAQIIAASPVSRRAVKGYLKRLTTLAVIVPQADGRYTAGARFEAWLATEPKTLPGGSAVSYLKARAKREAEERAERALIRAAQQQRGR